MYAVDNPFSHGWLTSVSSSSAACTFPCTIQIQVGIRSHFRVSSAAAHRERLGFLGPPYCRSLFVRAKELVYKKPCPGVYYSVNPAFFIYRHASSNHCTRNHHASSIALTPSFGAVHSTGPTLLSSCHGGLSLRMLSSTALPPCFLFACIFAYALMHPPK